MFRFAASVVCALPLWLGAAHATESECVVASVHPLATDAGLDAYRNGGNALDAAVATALTLGVVDTHNSGLGGGCFILVGCQAANCWPSTAERPRRQPPPRTCMFVTARPTRN